MRPEALTGVRGLVVVVVVVVSSACILCHLLVPDRPLSCGKTRGPGKTPGAPRLILGWSVEVTYFTKPVLLVPVVSFKLMEGGPGRGSRQSWRG